MYNNGTLSSSSRTSISHVEGRYATDRHEFEQTAKPWSELSEHAGPSLESSLSPPFGGETITRSLDQEAKTNDDLDTQDIDSSTSLVDHSLHEETTSFYGAARRYIKDILRLARQS
jgi:hypothetical protein